MKAKFLQAASLFICLTLFICLFAACGEETNAATNKSSAQLQQTNTVATYEATPYGEEKGLVGVWKSAEENDQFGVFQFFSNGEVVVYSVSTYTQDKIHYTWYAEKGSLIMTAEGKGTGKLFKYALDGNTLTLTTIMGNREKTSQTLTRSNKDFVELIAKERKNTYTENISGEY